MPAGAPTQNKNAEQWTINDATKLFNKAIEMSVDAEYDFIGEIARDLGVYRELFVYLADKFPEIKPLHIRILSNLEANCFSHTKKGLIREATGIVNLKSNYGWRDRADITTDNKPVTKEMPTFVFVDNFDNTDDENTDTQ